MARTLDLSRPYGSVQGTGVNYRHEQDGFFFDGQGNQVGAEKEAVVPAAKDAAGTSIYPPGEDAIALDGLDKDALHALAARLQVKVHQQAGMPKVTAALVAAFPAPEGDQLESQLNG